MKKNAILRKMLSLVLVISLLASFSLTSFAEENEEVTGSGLNFEQVDNSVIGSPREKKAAAIVEDDSTETQYEDTEVVRVSIVLDGESVIDAGYATENIAQNAGAMKHLKNVKNNQKKKQKEIEKAMKKALKVKHNLALASNIISADVAYGDIATIEAVSGVREVIVEAQYAPAETVVSDTPEMAVAGGYITGAQQAWKEGYTGAGTRIAVIDTGLDIDHQSFDNDAYVYAITKDLTAGNGKGNGNSKNKKKADKAASAEDLMAQAAGKYNLLTADEIAAVLPYLNAYAMSGETLTAADVSISDKIPFGFNYVDTDTNVRHIYDRSGEHGSHVAGIAAANRYLKQGDDYVDAASAVGVVGNAPDAQVLVMKVFGRGGGAYDSDYMAAIEDAIILGCDSVNLSLGSGNAGMTTSTTYQYIFDKLAATDTVVVISAGNSGEWAENTYFGELYADGISFDTVGSPASFTNALAVASIDNDGSYGYGIEVAGNKYGVTETGDYGNEPLCTLANGSEATYDYVFLEGFGEDEDFENVDVTGKVVFCSRGATSFYEKANNAVKNGAIATIIYNNQPGVINMNLTGYEYTAPAVSILQADGAAIKESSEKVDSYYVGRVTISADMFSVYYGSDYYTMSSFSSWGAPGNLSIKPEVSAPGGNIYSVNGATYEGGQHDQYELMSGTSAAAPQISGMAAVLKSYIKEKGLKAKTLTKRGLAQSLLMSTAEPMLDSDGYYYSVLQQGAGLGNVFDAMNADTYVTMGADATKSYADGKVKAELGDDPERSGVYNFTFTLTNLKKGKVTYNLDADVFTQYSDGNFLYGDTEYLEANVSFSTGSKVTVKNNGSVTVRVSIKLTEETKAFLDENYPAGAYVEAFVTAEPTNGSSAHSIPVLAYYGNWTDPSMYDVGSCLEYVYDYEYRPPYLYSVNGTSGNNFTVAFAGERTEYVFGENLYADSDDYFPEYASLNNQNGDTIKAINYSLIRNAGARAVIITDLETGEEYYSALLDGQTGAYYSVNGEAWKDTKSKVSLNWKGTGLNGDELPEGTKAVISLISVPEYYVAADGSFDVSTLGDGAFFSTGLTIDNTAPQLVAAALEGNEIAVEAEDNVAIASIDVYAQNGRTMIGNLPVNEAEFAGSIGAGYEDDVYFLVATDYAGNMSTYRIYLGIESTDVIESVELDRNELLLVKNETMQLNATVNPFNVSDASVVWSSSDEAVAIVSAAGLVTAVGTGNCTITAASVLDPDFADDCAVTVVSINKTLNGLVWDENGEIWFSEFNTADIPDYKKLTAAPADAAVNGLAYGADGTLYATDIDTEEGISSLYTVDSNFNLNPVGQSSCAYTEIAEAPHLGCLLATYFNYILAVDPATGDYIGVLEYAPNNLVGIAYAGSVFNTEYDLYADTYYILDEDGNLYSEAFVATDGSCSYLLGYEDALIDNTGIVCDTPYFQSLYFDGRYIFASCFNESRNSVTLYAIDTEDDDAVFDLGDFNDGVWPVAGLCDFGAAAVRSGNAARFAEAKVQAKAMTELPKLCALNVKK